jgi:hypothetical protein
MVSSDEVEDLEVAALLDGLLETPAPPAALDPCVDLDPDDTLPFIGGRKEAWLLICDAIRASSGSSSISFWASVLDVVYDGRKDVGEAARGVSGWRALLYACTDVRENTSRLTKKKRRTGRCS